MYEANVTANSWAGVVTATRESYSKTVRELIFRNRMLLAFMRKAGRIEFNHSGPVHAWLFKYKQPVPQQFGNQVGGITYSRKEYHAQAAVDNRAYILTDALTERDMLENSGPGALIKLGVDKVKTLMDGTKAFLNDQLYVDGYASGMEQAILGFESCLGAGACAVGDRVAVPSDTYGGRSTGLTAGISWSTTDTSPNSTIATDWPFGAGDAGDVQYDYWSPLLVNWSSNAWGTSSVEWEDNCLTVIRNSLEWQRRRCGSEEYSPDIMLTNSNHMIKLKDKLEQRFRFTQPAAKDAEDFGFKGTISYDGLTVQADYKCPADTSYILPVNMLLMFTLTNDLIDSMGPEWDKRDLAYLFNTRFYGNMQFESPKFFCKMKNYAAA